MNTKSFKDNYIELSKKFGGKYALLKKGIKRGVIQGILRGSIPKANEAYLVAQALNVTLEELITGKSIEENVSQNVVSGTHRVNKDPEDKHLIEKFREILKNSDQEHIQAITNIINIFCGEKMWIKKGMKEKRKKLILHHGKIERRLKIHGYS